jgi:nicotinate-nucleotide adenylyltransferase
VRIGLLGGSFDPPHNGHLLAAGDAFDELGLDRLLFIPAATQPLKREGGAVAPAQRLAMVRLLVADDPRFLVDAVEIDRGGLSYTVDTLSALAAREPAADRFLLIGADVLPTFGQWREPERIAELATLVVLRRAGEAVDLSQAPGTARVLATRRIDISSTEIRRRVREGKSVRGFVPDSVGAYIAAERLYR